MLMFDTRIFQTPCSKFSVMPEDTNFGSNLLFATNPIPPPHLLLQLTVLNKYLSEFSWQQSVQDLS